MFRMFRMFTTSSVALASRRRSPRGAVVGGERLESRAMLAADDHGHDDDHEDHDDHGHSGDVHVHVEGNKLSTEHGAFGWDFVDEGAGYVADIGFDADDQPDGSSLRLVPKTNLLYWNGIGPTPRFTLAAGGFPLRFEGYAGSRLTLGPVAGLGGSVTIAAEEGGVVHEHVAAAIGGAPTGIYAFYATIESTAGGSLAPTEPIAFVLNRGLGEQVHEAAVEGLEERPIVVGAVSRTPNGTLRAGQVIDIAVTFSEAVVVQGKPQIGLNVGGAGRAAVHHAYDAATRTSTFRYTVSAQDPVDADGIVIGRQFGFASGSSIRDADGGAAVLQVIPRIDGSRIRIDTTIPRSTGIVAAVAAGSYTAGQVLQFRVTFSKPVVVTGTPRLQFVTGGETRFAGNPVYVSGSNSQQLTFRYTVQPTDVARNGVTLRRAFALIGASVRDSLGNPAQFGTGVVAFPSIRVRPAPTK
jgi:hypothetical protein